MILNNYILRLYIKCFYHKKNAFLRLKFEIKKNYLLLHSKYTSYILGVNSINRKDTWQRI